MTAVTLYFQDFRDAGEKTGLSDADLMIRFRSRLNPEAKKLLVMMDLAQGDPSDLDDLEDRLCRAERALEAEGFSTRKRTETTTTTISATSTTQTNPVGGNGKTCKDFMRAVRNRCYGCGTIDHTKAQGNHGQEQCHHCKHLGHCTSVCQDKFLRRMPGLGLRPARVIRINLVVPFTLFPGETVNIGASPPAPTATITSTVPSTQVSASYTPSSNAVACIATLQDSLTQQNAAGSITHFARLGLTVDGTETWTDFLVTELGGENIILGLPWLRKTNPQVDWEKGQVSVPKPKVTIEEVEDEDWWAGTGNPPPSDSIIKSILTSVIEDPPADSEASLPLYHVRANHMTHRALVKKGILEDCHDDLWIAAGYTYFQQITEEASRSKPKQMFEEMVPLEYQGSRKVFSEEESERLPAHKPWDHAIWVKQEKCRIERQTEEVKVKALAARSQPQKVVATCGNCGKKGHTKEKCWSKGGGLEGKGPEEWRYQIGLEPNQGASASTSVNTTSSNPSMSTQVLSPADTYALSANMDMTSYILPF
ncbi:hypothetical protein PQX77_017216 [Marasmius sp. AFHP31]|nr:hypothetical protein PQX77_017216 [Marasmius sp. AFHP31]